MRETTKEFVAGTITRIVGGTSTIEAENIDIWADNITFIAGKKSVFTADKGIFFGDYVPPEEIYTTHPGVDKIEFLDENEKILDQNTKDFYYGQKLKIKVTTKDAKDGEMIFIQLKGKSKSKNQKFDLMDGSGFCWGFVPIKDNQYETSFFVLNPNWYSDDKEHFNYSTHETEIKEDDLNEFYALVTLNSKDVYLPLEGQRLKPITYKRNYEELIGLFKTDNTGEKDLLENYENLYINKYADENEDIKDIVDDFSECLCEDNPEATTDEIETKVAESAKKLWENSVWQHKDYINTIKTTNKETGEVKEEKKERKAILDDRPLYWARIVMQVILNGSMFSSKIF